MEQLYLLPILLFSVVVHEISHGWMALRLGDPTAKELGRLTLNPIPHIDPIGSILVPAFSLLTTGRVFIAWAKPVPVNPLNFSNMRRDDILVSVVGPISNLMLSLFCTVAVIVLWKVQPLFENSPEVVQQGVQFLLDMFRGGITLNIVLAVFNLIPIPPLDGSHVVASLLPDELSNQYRSIGFFGVLIIILLMRWEPFAVLFSSIISTLATPFQFLILLFA
jgi:Zn-dependent protease